MKKRLGLISISLIFLVGGCMTMSDDNNKENQQANQPTEEEFNDRYVSVNDYTGEGYNLPNGEATEPIAKEKFAEIEAAMKQFFLDEYKTEVIVHNAVGNVHGATVFVESVGEPHFHTYAMIGIDVEKDKILTDQIWTETDQVEQGIFSGLLAMIMNEEFAALDAYIEKLVSENPIVGLREEAVNNVKANAYSTPYYFVQTMTFLTEMERLNNIYFENPEISKEELKDHFDEEAFKEGKMGISINLYMKEPGVEPDRKLFTQIVENITKLDNIPPGRYSIYLHDNTINKLSAIGDKENSLEEIDIIK
ncbi:Protein of unknown function [Evansella caseinilytica]|uniref:DUF1672 family protein n=1 Tax=Evansella caseinilytica TaxID=1503961 RepID=A0A1H3HPV8_9BACI|nr:DUF1672 family protein [Evansella caseinilytica]SDY17450.1 Protein of unknown function [Evansella caseinilytica]